MGTAVQKLRVASHNIEIGEFPPSTMTTVEIAMRHSALNTENLAHRFLADAGKAPYGESFYRIP